MIGGRERQRALSRTQSGEPSRARARPPERWSAEPWRLGLHLRNALTLAASALLWAVSAPAAALAQDPVVEAPAAQESLDTPAPLTVAAVEARLAAAKVAAGIGDDLRARIVEAYDKALDRIREGDQLATAAQGYDAAASTAAKDLEGAKRQLGAGPAEVLEPPADATLADVEQAVTEARAVVQSADKATADADAEATRRKERRVAIPTRIPVATTELADVEQQLKAPADPADPAALAAARRTRLLARQRALQLELAALQKERASYEATDELSTARRDLSVREGNAARARIEVLQARVQALRTAEAKRQELAARAAAQEAKGQHSILQALTAENAALAQKGTALTESLDRVEAEQQEIGSRLEQLDKDFKDVRTRVEQVGLTEGIGALLRQRRSQVPAVGRGFRQRAASRKDETARVRLELFDMEDQRQALVTPQVHVDGLLDRQDLAILDPGERQSLREAAIALVESQRSILDELIKNYDDYFDLLVQTDVSEHRVLTLTVRYLDYINEHVLWVRSSAPLWRMDLCAWLDAGRWILDPVEWVGAGTGLSEELSSNPLALFVCLLGVALLVLRRRFGRLIDDAGRAAAKPASANYWPTGRALIGTLLIALPIPVLCWVAGAVLMESTDGAQFRRALGAGLYRAGWIMLSTETFRQVVRAGGLGEAHFRWKPKALALLRRNLFWLQLVVVPCALLIGMLGNRDFAPWSGTLGRTVLLVVLLALTVFLARLLHPTRGILADLDARAGVVVKLRPFWRAVGVAVPAGLFVLAALGWDFTSFHLLRRLELTLILVFVAFVAQALIVRALFLSYVKLAVEQAKERRRLAKEAAAAQAAAAQAAGTDVPPAVSVPELPLIEAEQIDPSKVAMQTQKLLRVLFGVVVALGAWQIWVDFVPAIGFLRHVTLWSDQSVDPPVAVTLASVLLAIVIALATLLAGRNVPGFLQFLILRRLPMQEGERHAITTLAQYAVVTIGVVWSFSAIGVGWSKVQWLVAAMSVGLGFGLQEVFANFVSGLILLFERPIRIGDLITVGDVIGRVSKMRIRATTLVDWDRREIVVPNREFVTGRFTNWTLSDTLTRVTIPVGIAYGSDTKLAEKLMLEVAHGCQVVLDEPKPRCVYRQFGESSLDFELRVFIRDMEDWTRLMNEIHHGIDQTFRKAGIEIAFPQRDLHIRSAPPIVEHFGHRARGEHQPAEA